MTSIPVPDPPAGPPSREPSLDPGVILDRLTRDGFAVIPGVLDQDEVSRLRIAAAEVADDVGFQMTAESPRFLHHLGAAFAHPEFTRLATDPRLLAVIAGALTPNIHVYHSHLDIHPPAPDDPEAWRWHEDGGRMTADIEARIMLSVKVAYWLSDVERDGYGNMLVIPGSHRWSDPLPRTPGAVPEGAVPVLATAGDATLFDRRIWHSRSTNVSRRTRRAVFFGYSPRWIAQREHGTREQLARESSPVRRQLLGCPDWDTTHVARADLPVHQLLQPTRRITGLRT